MPRRKGNQKKFQYAEAPVFKYQTFDRDAGENLVHHQNPIFPDQPILFSDRYTNSSNQSTELVASEEPEPEPQPESEPLDRKPTDEGVLLCVSLG